ncbi:MAG TPA: class I mannose-6-phosphate isomerase [Bryobacteraceae bacterium]
MLDRLPARFVHQVWGSEVWYESSAATPILVKFISTFDNLSVQVHPGDEYARLHHNCAGKTEMWHILRARPGARIAAGFKTPISEETLRQSAKSGDIEDLLEWHAANPGDTFFIPAGTVHSIGGGLVLCEIQQCSDIVYRLYDWGRRPPLHFERAVEVSRREPHTPRRDVVDCDYFTVRHHRVQDPARLGPAEVAVVIEGDGKLEGQPVRAGEVWHAGRENACFEADGHFTALTVSVK